MNSYQKESRDKYINQCSIYLKKKNKKEVKGKLKVNWKWHKPLQKIWLILCCKVNSHLKENSLESQFYSELRLLKLHGNIQLFILSLTFSSIKELHITEEHLSGIVLRIITLSFFPSVTTVLVLITAFNMQTTQIPQSPSPSFLCIKLVCNSTSFL